MTGTATHYCKRCGKKTTHTTGTVGIDGADALRCVVCGTVVPIITITKDPHWSPSPDRIIAVISEPPFVKKVRLDAGYLQVEAGHYPDGMNLARRETFARRVYVDEGGAAISKLLRDLVDLSPSNYTLPVWERGKAVSGVREA